MLVNPKLFKRQIPLYQSDAKSVDDYFFWERGKSTSVLSHFQQEFRKMEGYAILTCVRTHEFNTLVQSIKDYNSGDIKAYIKDIVNIHATQYNRSSVLLTSMNVTPEIDGFSKEFGRPPSKDELLELKKDSLIKIIEKALKPDAKVEKILKNAKNSEGSKLFGEIKLSPFIETENKTARQISDEYVVQKNNFRNGYLRTSEVTSNHGKKNEFVLGWEYLTDFVDKKIGDLATSSEMRSKACSNLFNSTDGLTSSKFMLIPEVKKLVDSAKQDFESLNRYRKLKSAIVQFREHGGDFTKNELLLNEEMLQRFVDDNKPEIIKDVLINLRDVGRKVAGSVKKSNIKVADVHPPEIFLPVIPIVETVNRVAQSHNVPIYIYDSGQKGFTSMSRKVKQDKYDGDARSIADGVRNTIAYGSEEWQVKMLNGMRDYLDTKNITYSYSKEVSGSGYLSSKLMVPVKLKKEIEFSANDKVYVDACRIGELKLSGFVELNLKKETDFLYHMYRQLCPEGANGKRQLMPTTASDQVPEINAANNLQRVNQILGELHSGLKARPQLVKKIAELNDTVNFGFPLNVERDKLSAIASDRSSLEFITSKIQQAEKLLNCQNLSKAPIDTQVSFYKASKQSGYKPEEFFDKKSLEALQKAIKTERLHNNIERSSMTYSGK